MGAISPLSANVVVNQGFIVAATAQSLPRQNKAFIAFVRPPLPVKMFHSLAFLFFFFFFFFYLHLFVSAFVGNNFLEKCLRCLPAMEHLSRELRSERRSGQQREQAGPVFDRCVLLLEPATSSALHNCVARTGLFRPRTEPFGVFGNSGSACHNSRWGGGDNGTVNKRRVFIAQG